MSVPRKFVAVIAAILSIVGVITCVRGFIRSAQEVVRFSSVDIGACVSGENAEDVNRVPCDDPEARYWVVDVESRPSPLYEGVLEEACADAVAADNVFWWTLEDGQVLILCLKTLNP